MAKVRICSTGSQVTTTNLGGGKCGSGIPEPAGEADRIYGFGMVKARTCWHNLCLLNRPYQLNSGEVLDVW